MSNASLEQPDSRSPKNVATILFIYLFFGEEESIRQRMNRKILLPLSTGLEKEIVERYSTKNPDNHRPSLPVCVLGFISGSLTVLNLYSNYPSASDCTGSLAVDVRDIQSYICTLSLSLYVHIRLLKYLRDHFLPPFFGETYMGRHVRKRIGINR